MKEWFSLKYYPHIGLPFTNKDKKRIVSYIKNKNKIASHSFLPFIHKVIHQRKLRKQYDDNGNLLNNGKRKLLPPKNRDIYYANHLDANIYSYYGFLLNKKYESILKSKNLDNVVTAYRRIPYDENRNKNNIDFANEVFNRIKERSEKKIVAIAFDIKSFFDNLKHERLKKAWCKLFNWDILPPDHYNVFKNITKFSYVEELAIFNLFKYQIYVKTSSGIIKQKKIDKFKYLYEQGAIAFCDLPDIHTIRKIGLIYKNKYNNSQLRKVGICQGSSISSVLANLYMLDFDEYVNNQISKHNGFYRRYSDDIVVVCPLEKKDEIITLIEQSMKNIAELEINTDKTQIFHFTKTSGRFVCEKELNGTINQNSKKWKFEYLGFAFDGNKVYLKTSSLAKFYRKMKLNARRSRYYASVIQNTSKGQIFKRRLYKRFSYIGSRRQRKYIRKRNTTNEWIRTKKYNWGNFITYAKLAINTMDDNKIKGQIKKHWKNLNNEIKKAESQLPTKNIVHLADSAKYEDDSNK